MSRFIRSCCFVFLMISWLNLELSAQEKNHGHTYNIVCIVRFAGESENVITRSYSEYNSIFNDSINEQSASVYNYFKRSSYGALRVISPIANPINDLRVVSYQDSHARGYFKPADASNTIGYSADIIANLREANLVNDVCKYIESVLPAETIMDGDKNNTVDNLCLILSGSQERNSVILYPHQSFQMYKESYIHGKRVANYNIQLEETLNTGTICHEFMHTLGAPDLYLANKNLPKAIGTWDLMSTNNSVPQGMSAYTQYRYGNWLPEPQILESEGTYQLNPLSGDTREDVWYKIHEPGRDEYFVVEYRQKRAPFEIGLPSSGLLVYRINEKFTGNLNYDGVSKLYGQYLFRQGGSPSQSGEILFAGMSAETGRTNFKAGSNPYPFYSNGDPAGFQITEIGECADRMKFHFKPQEVTDITKNVAEDEFAFRIEDSRILYLTDPDGLSQLTLYDLSGKIILSVNKNIPSALSLGNLAPGIYFLTMGSARTNAFFSTKIYLFTN